MKDSKIVEADVIFRRLTTGNKEVIALLPTLACDACANNVTSYMHTGQHGAASTQITQWTVPASISDADAQELKAKMERMGYKLKVVKKMTPKHRKLREAEIEQWRKITKTPL